MVQVQKRKPSRFVNMGPRPVPVVPIGQFTKAGGKTHNEMLESLWEIIGPSVELNLRKLPLWKVITMAYFEGSVHAVQMMEDEKNGNVS